jgi:hypothetical protein
MHSELFSELVGERSILFSIQVCCVAQFTQMGLQELSSFIGPAQEIMR